MSEPTSSVAVPDGLDSAVAPHLEAIASAVAAGDRAAVVATVRSVPTRQRRVLAQALETWFSGRSRQPDDDRSARDAYRLAAAGLVVSPSHAAARLRWMTDWEPVESRARAAEYAVLLGERGRAWLTRFAESLLADRRRSPRLSWHLVRHLMDAGLIEQPTHVHHRSDVLWAYHWKDLPALAADDPVLAAALRELFRTPGAGLVLGRSWDRYATYSGHEPGESAHSEESWTGLLAAWGVHDPDLRPGLLDDCITALSGSLPPSDAQGFIRVHARLAPTVDEVADRQSRYMALLLAPATGAVALAHTQLRRLLDASRLDGAGLLEATTDVLLRREKVVVREHLRLLTDGLAAGALDATACADAVVPALDPERTDLALLTARLLTRCARLEPGLVDRLAGDVTVAVPHPSPELRKALGRLAPAVPARDRTSSAPTSTPSAPHVAVPTDLPEPGRVEPVHDLDELTALLQEIHRRPATALDVERALDGLVRLRMERPAAGELVKGLFRPPYYVPPLREALRAWAGWVTPDAQSVVTRSGRVADPAMAPDGAELTELGPTGTRPDGVPRTEPEVTWWHWRLGVPAWLPQHLLDARLHGIRAGELRRPGAPLLATPTHEDGTVSADAFLARSQERGAAGRGVNRHDLATALLRLRPGDRDALRGRVRPDVAELLGVVEAPMTWRRRLVAVATQYDGGPSATISLWQATDSPTGAPDDPVRAWLDSNQFEQAWQDLTRFIGQRGAGPHEVGLWALTLPTHPDVFAAHAQRLLVEALEEPNWDVSPVMEILGAYRTSVGAPAVHALLVGGATRSARARASAADALAGLCTHGLVPAPALSEALLAALDPDAAPHGYNGWGRPLRPKPNRVAATLTDAARIDDVTGRAVLDALVAGLAPLSQLHGGVALVELAAQLAERFRARVVLPEPLAALAAGRSSSRTAQEARRLAAAGDR